MNDIVTQGEKDETLETENPFAILLSSALTFELQNRKRSYSSHG
jgi:hypothetical protein